MAATALDLPAGRSVVSRPGFAGDDDRLVTRVRHGDDAAFEAIYDRYAPGLLAFCHHLLSSRDDAEDALQHSLGSAYRMLRSDDREVELRPWLYTVARNRCLSMLRARRPNVSLETAAERGGRHDELVDQVQRRSDLHDLVQDLRLLPEDQRAALVLFELGGLTHDEIATVLEVRRDKVKALVFQAREALMRARHARDTPCTEMRRQLATLTGRIPKRSILRRHVDRCPSCALYQAEVGRQRAALALVLPVPLAAGLKSTILASIVGRGAVVAGGCSGAGAGTAVLGGGGGGAACAGAGGGGAAALAGAGATAGGGVAASGSLMAAGAAGGAGVGGAVATAGGAGTVAAALGAKGATAVVAKLVTVAAVVVGGGAATGKIPTPVPSPSPPAAQHVVAQVATPSPAPGLLAPDPVPAAPPPVLAAGTAAPIDGDGGGAAPAGNPADGAPATHAHTVTTPAGSAPATTAGDTQATASPTAPAGGSVPAAGTPDPAPATSGSTATEPSTGGAPAADPPATGGATATDPAATGGADASAPDATTTTGGATTPATTDATTTPAAESDTGGAPAQTTTGTTPADPSTTTSESPDVAP